MTETAETKPGLEGERLLSVGQPWNLLHQHFTNYNTDILVITHPDSYIRNCWLGFPLSLLKALLHFLYEIFIYSAYRLSSAELKARMIISPLAYRYTAGNLSFNTSAAVQVSCSIWNDSLGSLVFMSLHWCSEGCSSSSLRDLIPRHYGEGDEPWEQLL